MGPIDLIGPNDLVVRLGCPDSSSRKICLSDSMFYLFSRNLISEESYWSKQRDGILVLRDDLVFRYYVARTMQAITRNASCFATILPFDVLLCVKKETTALFSYYLLLSGVVILMCNMLNDGACKLMMWYL